MFTFGIFTTHIPYIAFVVFYAYFLIFGVEKASKGEIQAPGNTIIAEMHAMQHISADDEACYYYQADADFIAHSTFEIFHFKRKVRHRITISTLFHQFEIFTSLSNRPPPYIA